MRPTRQPPSFVYTPLITPFTTTGIDYLELERAVDIQREAGMDGIVILDPIGEGCALNEQERKDIIRLVVKRASGLLRVVTATGTNCTRASIERTRQAVELGADAVLVTVPYYSKPQLAGVLQHFRQVAECGVPVFVDDDPGRTAKDYGVALLRGLADIQGIVAICHGPHRTNFFSELSPDLRHRFIHLSRDDNALVAMLAIGIQGIISPIANVLARQVLQIFNARNQGKPVDEAFSEIAEAVRSIGDEDVAALKEAASFVLQFPADVRLPLVCSEAETVIRVRHAFTPFVRCEGSNTVAA